MSFIPTRILSKLFNRTSLRNCDEKVCFSVKNRLAPATLLNVSRIELDGADVPLDKVGAFEKALLDYANNTHTEFMGHLNHGDWNDELEAELKAVCDEFKSTGSW